MTDEENSELDYFPLPMYSCAIPRNEKWMPMLKTFEIWSLSPLTNDVLYISIENNLI